MDRIDRIAIDVTQAVGSVERLHQLRRELFIADMAHQPNRPCVALCVPVLGQQTLQLCHRRQFDYSFPDRQRQPGAGLLQGIDQFRDAGVGREGCEIRAALFDAEIDRHDDRNNQPPEIVGPSCLLPNRRMLAERIEGGQAHGVFSRGLLKLKFLP